MGSDLPHEKLIVGLVSFGLGLILSGRFLFGLLPIAAGAFLYLKNRAAYADLEKRLISKLTEAKPGDGAQKQELQGKNSQTEADSPADAPPLDNWYYERAGAAIGPLKETEIRNLLLNREISPATLVYHPVFGNEWRKVENTHFVQIAKRRPS